MNFSLYAILEACALALLCSADAFLAGLAYGSGNIKIPQRSVQIINIICSLTLGMSFLIGSILCPYLPAWLTTAVCFTVLFVIGIIKLLEGLRSDLKSADRDNSKALESSEAAILAAALSLDGLAVGFGAAMGNINGAVVCLCSLVTNMTGLMLGCRIGNKLAKLPFNISWLSGVLLILLAVVKLF